MGRFHQEILQAARKTVLPRVTNNLSILRNEFVALEKVQRSSPSQPFSASSIRARSCLSGSSSRRRRNTNRFVAAMRKGKLPDIVKQGAVVEGSLRRLSDGLMEYTRKTADAASKALPVLELTKDAGMMIALALWAWPFWFRLARASR